MGLIATPATVNSGAYAAALAQAAPEAELHAVASAELAPLIQEGGESTTARLPASRAPAARSNRPGWTP